MSLIVCSNNKVDNGSVYNRTCLDQAPFRFRNHLTNPLELPPNSEVSVQSCKLNKNSLIRVDPTHLFYQMYGQKTTTGSDPETTDRTTNFPIMCSILPINNQNPEYMNMTKFLNSLTDAMRLGFPHPDADWSDTGTFAQANRTGGSGAEFDSFGLNYAQLSSTGNGNYDPESPSVIGETSEDWKFLTDPRGVNRRMDVSLDGADDDKMVITCLETQTTDGSTNLNVCWMNEKPLSHQGGVFEIDLTGLQLGGGDADTSFKFNSGWAIGLARGTRSSIGQVGYLDTRNGDLSQNPHFYDYVVYCEQLGNRGEYFLRVGHFVYNDDETTFRSGKPCVMNEIVYYDNNDGSDFSSNTLWRVDGTEGLVQSGTRGYNMSRNWAKWDRLRFVLNNEDMRIELESSQGGAGGHAIADTPYVLTGYLDATGRNGTAINYPKPCGTTAWCMTPKVMIRQITKSITIDKYDGRTMTYKGENLTIADGRGNWFCRMVEEGQPRLCMDLDSRYMFQMNATNDYTILGTETLDGDTINSEYDFITILGNGSPYYTDTSLARMQSRLGFDSFAILEGGDTTAKSIVYTSDTIPELMDYSSLFVRLDNFTQRSYNANTGRPSKILYQVPRFDTSNRETGNALYYEPHERTYIKLNNTDPIALNEIQLSLCDNEERLADKGIVGTTIICLHFRQSLSPLLKSKF